MTIFVEGINEASRVAIIKQELEINKTYKGYFMNDVTPIQFLEMGYLTVEEYKALLEKYSEYKEIIEEYSNYYFCRDEYHYLVDYKSMNIELEEFNAEMKKHELFGGNFEIETFLRIVKSRFINFYGDRVMFELKFFGRIIDEILLFSFYTDEDIYSFYREVAKTITCNYFIYYLEPDDIEETIREDCKKDQTLLNYYIELTKKSDRYRIENVDDLIDYYKERNRIEKNLLVKVFPNRFKYL